MDGRTAPAPASEGGRGRGRGRVEPGGRLGVQPGARPDEGRGGNARVRRCSCCSGAKRDGALVGGGGGGGATVSLGQSAARRAAPGEGAHPFRWQGAAARCTRSVSGRGRPHGGVRVPPGQVSTGG